MWPSVIMSRLKEVLNTPLEGVDMAIPVASVTLVDVMGTVPVAVMGAAVVMTRGRVLGRVVTAPSTGSDFTTTEEVAAA